MGVSAPKVFEKHLIDVWINQSFSKQLVTLSGLEVSVLDVGDFDDEISGPDFKNARIRIGNLTYVGDIEIDHDYTNWKSHGHNIDNKYDKTILHISLVNKYKQQYVYTKEGRKVPTLCISEFLDDSIVEKFKSGNTHVEFSNNNNKLKCSSGIDIIQDYEKKKVLGELGILRYNKKCTRIFNRLKELSYLKSHKINEPVIGYDLTEEFSNKEFTTDDFNDPELWQQLFYEFIFEALGYSKNKTIMMKLAQSANINFLKKLGHDGEVFYRIESALFNISGLTPDAKNLPKSETSDYTKRIYELWENISRIYDGETFNETQWHFFKLRPQNFPTIRLAGGTHIIYQLLYNNLIPSIIKKVDEIRNLNVLINSIRSLFVIKSTGFWREHYVFDHKASSEIKYFVGASRADEMVVNVVLPFFSVYFNVFNNDELSKKILKTYNIYNQNADNKIVREVAESLKATPLLKKTVFSQGMIELFRTKCSKGKCLECSIGEKVFN